MNPNEEDSTDRGPKTGDAFRRASVGKAAPRDRESIQPDCKLAGEIQHNLRSSSEDTQTKPMQGSSCHADLVIVSETEPPNAECQTTRYEIRSHVACGGMGVIYRAYDPLLERDVALKVLRPGFQGSPELMTRFVEESRIMSSLQHPGVAPVYNCGTCDDGRPFHAMKLVNGRTLGELLKQSPPSHQATLLNIFAQVCQTLAYAHAKGVIHLDVKPSNVMVGAFGEVHVMDWGLAQWSSRLTHDQPVGRPEAGQKAKGRAGQVQGTPAYMSPEQAQGSAVDTRTDVFGLGAILCEVLTGLPPYSGKSVQQLYRRARRGAVSDALRALEACESHRALVRLTKRCLAQDPGDRPADAGELAREVASYQESALARVESDMERFFELSLDLFCIAGFDGYFRRINANFSRVLGYDDNDLLSRPFLEFVHADDRQQTVEQMGRLLDGQPVVRFRNRYRTAAGECILFEWTAKSLPDEQQIFAVARDLT